VANQIKKKFLGADQVSGDKILLDNEQALRAKMSNGFSTDVFKLDANDKIIAFRDGMSPEEIAYQSDISGLDGAINGHIDAVSDAHDASAISVSPSGNLGSTNVQLALEELQLELDGIGSSYVDVSGDTMSGNLDMDGNNIVGLPVPSANGQPLVYDQLGANSGVAPLSSSGKIDAQYLPSYVDDVEEYANLAGFPGVGESGKIYVALDTNKTYRWSGSQYIEISPSEVNSVNGATGIVVLDSDDISEGSSNLYFTDARAQSASVADAIVDGVTNVAPSQNAVHDALALKYDSADFNTDWDNRLSQKDTDDLAEGTSNLYFTDARAKTAAVANAINDGIIDVAPSQDAVHDALALKLDIADFPAEFSSELATKSTNDLAEGGSNLYFTDARAKSAAVADLIQDGVLDVAPSQNAVFDAISVLEGEDETFLKLDGSRTMTGTLQMDFNSINAVGAISGPTEITGQVGQTMTFGISSSFIFQSAIDMQSASKIVGLSDGVDPADAVNKGQLDGVESALDSRIDALESAVAVEWATPYKRTLDATDLSNGYIDLPHEAVQTNGMGVFADRLALHQGASEDYTLSVSGGVTRITFGGDLVGGGATQPLQEGDSIYVRYQKAI
jgi:hypothetical protein